MWISKEKYEDIERRVKELNEELQRLYNMAYLTAAGNGGQFRNAGEFAGQ